MSRVYSFWNAELHRAVRAESALEEALTATLDAGRDVILSAEFNVRVNMDIAHAAALGTEIWAQTLYTEMH